MARRIIRQWSYSGDPATSTKDEVRFLVVDTDSEDKQIDDCEINYLLAKEGSPINAAICACIGLIAIYSRDFDGKFGDTTSAKITENYRGLLAELRAKRAEVPYVMFAGGLSRAAKLAVEENIDRVDPAFTVYTGNNPRAAEPTGVL